MSRIHPAALREFRVSVLSRGAEPPRGRAHGGSAVPSGSASARRRRAAQRFWQLPDSELDRLLALAGEADRVELKLVVPTDAHESTCVALGVDFARARRQRVLYLDTPDRALHRNGAVARLRSIAGGSDDAVVKLRPLVPTDVPRRLRRSKDFVIEVDGMPGYYVCSGALRARLGTDDVARVMTRSRPPHRLFTRPQLRLLAARLPAGFAVEDLMMFGPVDARRAKIRPEGLGRRLFVERWTYPDGSRLLELSTRCAPAEALPVAARAADVLRRHGVDLTGPQQTKTRLTLDFFSGTGPSLPLGTDAPIR
ncbi:CYTH domain-containing protein [Frankia sp. EI5c]|uniref:CYTH domain-containing protein n=1 Tax=Frankia sp. EI5c TaxID=683316 RepID=UPI0007C34298|nr:CYTH domain-containing protein [Frankia sp. EI5c]OAA25864.1 CYTH domain-containing protein [Frankia sp. EI5c]